MYFLLFVTIILFVCLCMRKSLLCFMYEKRVNIWLFFMLNQSSPKIWYHLEQIQKLLFDTTKSTIFFYLIPILDLFGRSDYHAFLKKTNNSQNCLLWKFSKYNPNDDDDKYISISICIFARFGYRSNFEENQGLSKY